MDDSLIERADTALLEGALEHVRAHHKQHVHHNLLQASLLLVIVVSLLACFLSIDYISLTLLLLMLSLLFH